MGRAESLEKTLMLGKIEGRRRRGQQRMRWSDAITDSMDEFEQALGNAAVDVGNLISGSSAFSKTNLNIWKFSVHQLSKPYWKILSIILLVYEMSTIMW